jgi:hypothetical protein
MEESDEKKPEEKPEVMEEQGNSNSGKYVVIFLVVIVLIFASVFIFGYIKAKNPVTIDSLHDKNLEGKFSDDNFMYNGFSFVYFDNLWYTRIQDENTLYDVALRFNPKEVEDVPIDVNLALIDSETFPEIYITIDPYTNDATYQTLAVSELGLNLVRAMDIIPRAACTTQDNDACIGRDIINCSYEYSPIIFIKEADTPMVFQDNTCFVIQGKELDLMKSIDRFIYKIYGIIP